METIRFRFKRTAELRLISHLDMQRIFGRAFRRAGIPLAYSQGFNPHPKLAFAGALPFGMITDDEYGDVVLEAEVKSEEFIEKMNSALPAGLTILSVEKISVQTPSLSVMMTGAEYKLHVFTNKDIEEKIITQTVDQFLKQSEILIQKRNKKGKMVETDIRPYIQTFSFYQKKDDEIVFDLSTNVIDQKSVKPVLVLSALDQQFDLGLILDETVMLHKEKNHFALDKMN